MKSYSQVIGVLHGIIEAIKEGQVTRPIIVTTNPGEPYHLFVLIWKDDGKAAMTSKGCYLWEARDAEH